MKDSGLFVRFIDEGYSKIHPEDIEAAHLILPYGKVFELVGFQNEYMVLKLGYFAPIRAKVECTESINPLPIEIGSRFNSSGNNIVVREIQWHIKRGEPIFLVYKNGKKSTRWYFLDELKEDLLIPTLRA